MNENAISRISRMLKLSWPLLASMTVSLFLFLPNSLDYVNASERSGGARANEAEPGEWYVPTWLTKAPYAPVFDVRDTLHKYGRYAPKTKRITVSDLVKFHGHLCGGLVEAACALRLALDELFKDGIIDRTDLRVVSNNSACGADVASYLTGARVRFASHNIDKKLKGGGFIVQRISTGETVRVWRNPVVYPAEVKTQMKKIESGAFSSKDIDLFGKLQWAYAERLINRPIKESFFTEPVKDYRWPDPVCKDLGERKDNNYKSAP